MNRFDRFDNRLGEIDRRIVKVGADLRVGWMMGLVFVVVVLPMLNVASPNWTRYFRGVFPATLGSDQVRSASSDFKA